MKKKNDSTSAATSESPASKPKKRKEATKSREWERERRERLNNSFSELSKMLPTSDNKAITKKMDILQKATTFIKSLQEENAELLESGGLEKSWSREVKQLQCQVKELTNRNQQLVSLLQEAGGKLPAWVSLPATLPVPPPLGKRQFLYTNKLSQEDGEKTMEKLVEPKSKKARKTSPQKEKDSNIIAKKKKSNTKASPKKQGNALPPPTTTSGDNLNQITPVAQLLNVSLNNKKNNNKNIDTIPSTSGLVILPPDKNPSIDLAPGILLLKNSTQSHSVPPNNSLSSGGLLIMRPSSLQSQQSSTLAPGTCIILPPTSSNTMLQTTPLPPQTTNQAPAQTTTILTTPIMATGQSTSLVQASQSLTSTPNTNNVTPTYVLTNGNLVPVLSTSSTSQTNNNNNKHTLAIIPKAIKDNKNANKVPIPKLPKRNIKGNKIIIKKKNISSKQIISKISASDLKPLKSIVTTTASTDKVTLDPPTVSAITKTTEISSVKSIENTDTNKEIIKESIVEESPTQQKLLETEQTSKNILPCSTPDTPSKTMSHKTSYSIDALCKGKNGTSPDKSPDQPVSNPEDSQSSSVKPKDTITNHVSEYNVHMSDVKQVEKSVKDAEKVNSLKLIEETPIQDVKKIGGKDKNNIETSIEKHSNKEELSKVSKTIDNSNEPIIDNSLPLQSSQSSSNAMIFTEPMQSAANRNYYNTYDTCTELRNQEFPPAQISPSGFIGPQPPMATVVSAPLAKDGIEQYSQSPAYRNTNEENCREQENAGISDNIENQQQNDVLTSNMPSSFSSDIFASLNVPSGHPESISPTAAFLLAFPLVSSSTGRTNELLSEPSDLPRSETCTNNPSNSLLQLGSMDENPPTVHPMVENDHLSTNSSRAVEVTENNSNILQNNHNIITHDTHYNKSHSKTMNLNISMCNTSSTFSSSGKQSDINHLKQYNTLPPMPHSYSINEHLSDYDAEISSIMSNTSQAHDMNQNHNQKVQRNVPSNISNNTTAYISKDNEKCREVIKMSEPQQYIPAQQLNMHTGSNLNSNISSKQYNSLPIQNNTNQILPEIQQHASGHQMQPPIYRPCNTVKNKIQSQHSNSYQNNSTAQFSTSQQVEGITSCAPLSYNQPIARTTMANIISHSQHQKIPTPRITSMRNDILHQKTTSEQNDTSYYIGKLNTSNSEAKVVNSHQKYKVCSTDTTPSQTSSNTKTAIVNNNTKFDRNINSSSENMSRHNFIPTASISQPYSSYNIFNNDYQTSTYLPLPNIVSTAPIITSSIISDTANATLTSFPKGHNTSSLGILSWTTLSPMPAPNTQQLPSYEASYQKQNAVTPYQHTTNNNNSYGSSNENTNKLPSYQQSSRAQISYPPPPPPIPPQINKEPTATPRPPVNWMTTPDIRNENTATVHNSFDHTAIPCTTNSNVVHKETNTSCNSFMSNSVYTECTDNLGHSGWQTSKTNLQSQNTSNPLPTLIGDLALGPTPSNTKYCSPYKTSGNNGRKQQDKDGNNKRNEYNPAGSSGSFLSVSQLVDHVKETNTTTPRGGSSSRRTTRPSSKAASRRDRNKNQNTQQTLHFNEPPPVVAATTYPTVSNWPAPKTSYKPAPSNYSAEALIGLPVPSQQDFITPTLHTSVDKVNTVDRYSQNYTSRTHFTTDGSTNNYFSEAIETTYQQTPYTSNCNPSNYQSTNNYIPNTGQTFNHGSEIASSSITGSSSFTTELSTGNFLLPATTTSMGTSRTGFFPSEITTNTTQSKNSNRSNKRRSNNEHSESYQDNSYSNNNTSVHQHTHQEYGNTTRSHPTAQHSMVPQASTQSCVPTYHTSRGASVSVQTTTSPSHSSTSVVAAGGSSLTNFNLSTIFPEMNDKVPVPTLPAFVSSKNLGAGAPPLLSGSSTDYMLHHPNMSFNNLLGPPSHQVGIGINQSFATPSFPNMMPPSLPFSVHEH